MTNFLPPTILPIPGDEILAVNGEILHGLSHDEAIAIFKRIRSGPVVMQIGRRGGSGFNASGSSGKNVAGGSGGKGDRVVPPPSLAAGSTGSTGGGTNSSTSAESRSG